MMKKPKIVVNKHTPYVVPTFETIGDVIALDTSEIKSETVKDADILIVRSETKVNKDLLSGSNVKFVGTVTIGTDHVDENYLKENNIAFVSAPGCNANSVGEYITAALLELACKNNFSLKDKTIGIVGVGNVGSNVYKKAQALGMKILLNDPPLKRNGSQYDLCSLDELMCADIITIHVPLTKSGIDATYHLFDEKRIGKMKKGAILINSSRGSVVETNALLNALSTNHIHQAVLDVWEGEPKINHKLLELVTIATPHIAGYSIDGKVNALRMNYESVCNYLNIKPENIINNLFKPEIVKIHYKKLYNNFENNLNYIVKQTYDILFDDKLIREEISMDENDRKKHFSALRANYRIRKEFNHTEILINKNETQMITALKLLGYNLKIEE